MGPTTELLTSAIERWHLDATTGAKDTLALRHTMLALAANIDSSHSQLSGADRARLQNKLESTARAVKPAEEAGLAGDRAKPKLPPSGDHISIFA